LNFIIVIYDRDYNSDTYNEDVERKSERTERIERKKAVQWADRAFLPIFHIISPHPLR